MTSSGVYVLRTYDLLVNVVLGCLHLWHVFRVSDEPQDLVTGKRQSHEDKQGLGDLIGTENRAEKGVLAKSLTLRSAKAIITVETKGHSKEPAHCRKILQRGWIKGAVFHQYKISFLTSKFQ